MERVERLRAAMAEVDPADLTADDRLALLDLWEASYNAATATPVFDGAVLPAVRPYRIG